MITPTEPAPVLGAATAVPSFHLVLTEPALTVSVHLVSRRALAPKSLAVCLHDPAHPDEPLVHEHGGWSFSRRLDASFAYAPATDRPAVVSLPVAQLLSPANALVLTVHPWASGSEEAAGAVSEAWFGVTRADGSLDVSKVARA
jgi:hypothetical protein